MLLNHNARRFLIVFCCCNVDSRIFCRDRGGETVTGADVKNVIRSFSEFNLVHSLSIFNVVTQQSLIDMFSFSFKIEDLCKKLIAAFL